MKNNKRILVTGACGPAGKSLLTQLEKLGYQAIGCDLAPENKADTHQVFPICKANADEFIPQLLTLITEHKIDLVIPTVCEELPILAKVNIPQVVVAPLAAVETAADKLKTWQVAKIAGLAVPESVSADKLSTETVNLLGSPYIVRPRTSRGGRGVRLETSYPTRHKAGRQDIASAFLPGKEYCVQTYIPEDPVAEAKPCLAFVLEKTALKSGTHGNAVDTKPVQAPHVAKLGLEICQAIGLTGPADVDIREDANAIPHVIEVNARFGAQSAKSPKILQALLEDKLATGFELQMV